MTWICATASNADDIFVQKFDSSNNAVGTKQQLFGASGSIDDRNANVVVTRDGGYVVTWEGGNATFPDVYVQKFDSTGNKMGAMKQLFGTSGSYADQSSQVIATNDGGYVVAWQGATVSNATDIFVQKYDHNNNAVGGLKTLAGAAGNYMDVIPALTATNDGGYVVSWTANSVQINLQKFDAGNNAVGGMQNLPYNSGYQGNVITSTNDGGYVVSYRGSNGSTDDWVLVQKFDAAGVPVGTTSGTGSFSISSSVSNLTATQSVVDYVVTYAGGSLTLGGTSYATGSTIAKATWDAAVTAKTVLFSNASATAYSFELKANVFDSASNKTTTLTVLTKGSAVSPLVFDLNADGTIGYTQQLMDVNLDGHMDQSAWAAPQDGVLVWNKFGNGLVTDKSQYAFTAFGGLTDLQGLRTGFDTNADGVFDARDAKWAEFGVWQDANGNGVTDAGEFKSLTNLGIKAIHLQSTGALKQPATGVTEFGHFVIELANGQTMQGADAAFAYETLPAHSAAGAASYSGAELASGDLASGDQAAAALASGDLAVGGSAPLRANDSTTESLDLQTKPAAMETPMTLELQGTADQLLTGTPTLELQGDLQTKPATMDTPMTLEYQSGLELLPDGLPNLNLLNLDNLQLSLDNLGNNTADLSGNGQTDVLTLQLTDLLHLPTNAQGMHQLKVLGDSTDVVTLEQLTANGDPANWTQTGTATHDGHTYNVYQTTADQTLQVLIDQQIAQSNVYTG